MSVGIIVALCAIGVAAIIEMARVVDDWIDRCRDEAMSQPTGLAPRAHHDPISHVHVIEDHR